MVEAMLLKKIANLNHVPYRGGAPLLTDFFGNHMPVAATPILPIIQHAAAGTIVPLAVTSTERIAVLKDVPTFEEIGYPEMNGAIWFWLSGPKGLPAPIVEKLNAEVRKLINAPETKQQFEKTRAAVDGCRRAEAHRIHRGGAQALDGVRRGKGIEEIAASHSGARAKARSRASSTRYGARPRNP